MEENVSSSTTPYNTHKPVAWGLQIVSELNEIPSRYISYRKKTDGDPDPEEKLFEELDELVKKIKTLGVKPLALNAAEERQFQIANKCHICLKRYGPGDVNVRDHDHYTGEYRGSSCQGCNVNYTDCMGGDKFVLPVVAHNMRGYDG